MQRNKLWGKKGARIKKLGTRRVVPLETLLKEEKKLGKMLLKEYLNEEERNVRKAHCKLCGATLERDEGRAFWILASDGYNRSKYYACSICYPALEVHLLA